MNDQVAITITPSAMPTLSMAQAKSRRDDMLTFVRSIMVPGSDYGVIPGTGAKPTLLKPGAEKLATFFGLRPIFQEVRVDEDWTGEKHGGVPFFYYWFRCQLLKGNEIIAEGDGSCNSMESKYRYRQGERKCPECGKPAIIKGRAEYGGGWLCFAKKGGCGAKFVDGDKEIEGQQVGRVENPDMADQVNTILKMAQKRALVAAVLIGVNASEFFTQDIEDMAGEFIEGEYRVSESPATSSTPPASTPANGGNGAQRKATPPPAQGNGKGEKEQDVVFVGSRYGAEVRAFVNQVPYYQDAKGNVDGFHIKGTLRKLNIFKVTNENIDSVWTALRQYAEDKEAVKDAPEPQAETAPLFETEA